MIDLFDILLVLNVLIKIEIGLVILIVYDICILSLLVILAVIKFLVI